MADAEEDEADRHASIDRVAVEFGAMERADEIGLDDYLGLDVPVRLLVGGRTRRPTRAVVEVLAGLLPNVEVKEVARAGHMSPFTHREVVNGLLAGHIERHSRCRSEGNSVDAETVLTAKAA